MCVEPRKPHFAVMLKPEHMKNIPIEPSESGEFIDRVVLLKFHDQYVMCPIDVLGMIKSHELWRGQGSQIYHETLELSVMKR